MDTLSLDLHGRIALCPSAPHRAVLGLMRAALGRPVGPGVQRDLAASDPHALVQIATYNYLHVLAARGFSQAPALAAAVPDDLVIYFGEMHAANLKRNAAIRAQAEAIGALLAGAGLGGVALKGGAELLAPLFPAPGLRFLSDLDILVPERDLAQTVALLHSAGAEAQEALAIAEIDAAGHHHVTPLIRQDWPVPVELHRWLGQGELRGMLAPEAVAAAARPSGFAGLAVPAPAHRLAHAVQHAQLQPARFRDGLLSPRDLAEAEVLRAALTPEDRARARALFDGDGLAAWDALDAAAALVFGGGAEIEALSPAARGWAERALAGFGQPGRRRLGLLARSLGWYATQIVTNPARRRHYLRQIARPGRLGRVLRAGRAGWRRTR